MTENTTTFEYKGVEFDVDDVEACVEYMRDVYDVENLQSATASSNGVVMVGDGDADNYVEMFNKHGENAWGQFHEIEEMVEEARMPPFEQYLRDNVFTAGTYTYKNDVYYGDIGVAEYDDGTGLIMLDDMDRVVADDSVEQVCVRDGFFCLNDNR